MNLNLIYAILATIVALMIVIHVFDYMKTRRHAHRLEPLDVQRNQGLSGTVVLSRCTCGQHISTVLTGTWTLAQLRGMPAAERTVFTIVEGGDGS